MEHNKLSKNRSRLATAPGPGLVILLLATLLAACGSEATTAPTATILPTTTAAQRTTLATNTTTQTSAPAITAAQTSAPATTIPASTQAAITTIVPVATTAPATTAPPPTKAAAALPPVGNSYPAGPAPTAAPPEGGLVTVTLQVPDQFKVGRLTQPRQMKVPQGFSIGVYAVLGGNLRHATFSPDGRLFASERSAGQVIVLKDNGATGDPQTFADGLNGPHGLAFHAVGSQMYLYVAENNRVTRFAYQNGQAKADKREVVVTGIPTGGNHTTRSIAFGPDNKMYISIGSTCNVCEESDNRRAAVMQYNEDGSAGRLFATGLRNEVGIAFYPLTGELWGVENSRDDLGNTVQEINNLPPEEINIIQDGKNYGWPYCYSNQLWDSKFGKKNVDYCKTTVPPALPMQAHSAPLGLDFYFPKAQMFPADFKGDAFVGFHGSWNSHPATGYKVVRVRVKDGRPVSYEDFVTGWQTGPESYWGRPVDPVVAPDGSLFITDDETNVIYRVTYGVKQ